MPYKRLKVAKGWIDAAMSPSLRRAHRLGIRPIHLTLLSLPCGLLGVYFLWERPALAALCLGCYLALDVLDGTLARATGTVSDFGSKLDFFFDMIIAVAFLANMYLKGIDTLLPATGIALIFAVGLEEAGLIKRRG
jgi:phosphatidylglycerophosphate synthase